MYKLNVLLGLLLSNGLLAQKTTVEIGPEMGFDQDFWGLVHSDTAAHYVLLLNVDKSGEPANGATPTLQKFDRSFTLQYASPLTTYADGQYFGNIFYTGDRFLLCTNERNKKEKSVSGLIATVGLDGRVRDSLRLDLVHYKKANFGPIEENWLISADSSKLLFAIMTHNGDDHYRAKVSLNVLGDQLQKIWSQEFSLPFDKEQLTERTWMLGNDGQVYLLSKVYKFISHTEWKMVNGTRRPAYEWIIFRFSPDHPLPQKVRLDVPDKVIAAATISLDKQNNLVGAGFYADDSKKVARGLFFTRFNHADGQAGVTDLKGFSAAELADFDTQKDKSGDRGLDSKFNFNQILVRPDGSMVVIAEAQEEILNSGPGMVTGAGGVSPGFSGGGGKPIYLNNEIFVANISASGQVDWINKIPKKQHYYGTDLFNGYMLMVTDSALYFLYNDNKANLDKPFKTKVSVMDDLDVAAAALVGVQYDGSMHRTKVFDAKMETEALMAPKFGKQISPNELFFLTRRTRFLKSTKFHLGVVRVE